MSQKEKDNKVLQLMRRKLTSQNSKCLSIANQIILAFLWYTISCVDIFLSSLKKVKTFVCNFFWLGKTNSKAKVKAAWDTTILPWTKGPKIKILDLEAQTFTLLVKMLIQGLNPRLEPWKILIRHRVDQLKHNYRGQWHPTTRWLIAFKKTS